MNCPEQEVGNVILTVYPCPQLTSSLLQHPTPVARALFPLQGELLTLKSGRVEASYFTLKTNTIACSIQDILRSEVLHVFLTLLVVMVVSLLLFFGNCNFAVMNCRINNLIYRLSHV